jgi:hypothetical protein
VQKKMVGMVSGLSATSYEGRLAALGLDSLESRRINADICTMHKLVHGIGEVDISEWFENRVGDTVTRARADPLNVLSKKGNLELRRNFFTIRVAKNWNAVPSDIKNIFVPGQFKRALVRWQSGARAERGHDHAERP